MNSQQTKEGSRSAEAAGPGEPSPNRLPRMTRTHMAGLMGFVLGLGALGVVAALPGEAHEGNVRASEGYEGTAAAESALDGYVASDPWDISQGFVAVAEETIPGVVRIETARRASADPALSNLPPGFEQFFGPGNRGPSGPQVSGGTGFVMSEDGYVLTNHHVVDDAEDVTVWLHDGRSFMAEVIGTDPTTDVAVLQIEADDLHQLPIGDSDRVRVGEWVVAVGNPGFQGGRPLDESVTAGIVSAVGRPLTLIRNELARNPESRATAQWAIEDFIQTDAVINPGNSGGPLVNLRGEVIGINTAIMSASGYYQGYGFAVPANLALGVAEDLIEDGSVRRGWIGLRISGVTAEDAEALGLDQVAGVLVQGVTEDGPADDAGLEFGDVIVALDGTSVDRVGALQQQVARRDPGDRVRVTVVRDGRERELDVVLGEAPIEASPRLASTEDEDAGTSLLGASFEALDGRDAARFGWDDEGILITAVQPGGPVARAGIAPGSRVVSINRREVAEMADLNAALADVSPRRRRLPCSGIARWTAMDGQRPGRCNRKREVKTMAGSSKALEAQQRREARPRWDRGYTRDVEAEAQRVHDQPYLIRAMGTVNDR